jgi:hypothetical protein
METGSVSGVVRCGNAVSGCFLRGQRPEVRASVWLVSNAFHLREPLLDPDEKVMFSDHQAMPGQPPSRVPVAICDPWIAEIVDLAHPDSAPEPDQAFVELPSLPREAVARFQKLRRNRSNANPVPDFQPPKGDHFGSSLWTSLRPLFHRVKANEGGHSTWTPSLEVPGTGFEPAHPLQAPAPQAGVSANSTTRAGLGRCVVPVILIACKLWQRNFNTETRRMRRRGRSRISATRRRPEFPRFFEDGSSSAVALSVGDLPLLPDSVSLW